MAEKSMTNAKTPNQVAKTARKASGSTRKDRKAAVKSVARSTAKLRIGHMLSKKADKAAANDPDQGWFGETANQKKATGMGKASLNAFKAMEASKAKAASLGVKPKKIAKTAERASKAVSKRVAQAQKVQGTYKANKAASKATKR
jgi:hypothetical protein